MTTCALVSVKHGSDLNMNRVLVIQYLSSTGNVFRIGNLIYGSSISMLSEGGGGGGG